ncbi:MAG: hypothetical protein LAP87_06320 [Acidobacteriia bacterium]|nr:hypothetical protein [Terriglobia bacterium]
MGSCNQADELAIRHLMAVDSVADARREVSWAVTTTQRECAATRLRRVEAHRLCTLRDLAAHCERHQCTTPEVERLLADSLVPERMAVAR